MPPVNAADVGDVVAKVLGVVLVVDDVAADVVRVDVAVVLTVFSTKSASVDATRRAARCANLGAALPRV